MEGYNQMKARAAIGSTWRRRQASASHEREEIGSPMQTSLLGDEVIVKEGFANLQRGLEAVGGLLYLTDRRLIFESHKMNIQTGATIVPLDSIIGVRKCWTRFLNLIPIFPNSFAVTIEEEKEYRMVPREYRFVTFERAIWVKAIEEERSGLSK
jgi:GRAM domain